MYWPLAVSNFTVLDKLKIAKWLITEKHWSQGDWVREYEKTWEKYTKAPHAVMVSSGSAANHMIAYRRKWELQQSGDWPKKKFVIFPVVNWISSVSPWLQLGFEPIFVDVSSNICSSTDHISKALKRKNIAAVFYTSLLGLACPVGRLRAICNSRNVPLYMDNCEATFSSEFDEMTNYMEKRHFCNFCTSSTSFYFSHHTSGNQEGGMIFCQTKYESDWYRMARNHGMTRGMSEIYKNTDVDPRFDFYMLGSNHRSTNLIAYMASLDFKRALDLSSTRMKLSEKFSKCLDDTKYCKPHRHIYSCVPLVLPIICRGTTKISGVKRLLDDFGVEHRPIVGGNLLRHRAFWDYGRAKDYPIAQNVHDNGLYIGLHSGVTMEMVRELTDALNRI